jgi:hypothetical protein
MFEHAFLIFFPEVWDDFGVAVCHQAMPARFELCPLLRVIEKLTVKNDRYAPVFVGDRLLAISQADNTEPSRPQDHAWALKVTLLVRAAMNYRLRHPLDNAVRDDSGSG